MKRFFAVLFLLILLAVVVFWIWRSALLLDENNSLRNENLRLKSERDNIDKLYQETLLKMEALKEKYRDR